MLLGRGEGEKGGEKKRGSFGGLHKPMKNKLAHENLLNLNAFFFIHRARKEKKEGRKVQKGKESVAIDTATASTRYSSQSRRWLDAFSRS
jgi:hypothetical protein